MVPINPFIPVWNSSPEEKARAERERAEKENYWSTLVEQARTGKAPEALRLIDSAIGDSKKVAIIYSLFALGGLALSVGGGVGAFTLLQSYGMPFFLKIGSAIVSACASLYGAAIAIENGTEVVKTLSLSSQLSHAMKDVPPSPKQTTNTLNKGLQKATTPESMTAQPSTTDKARNATAPSTHPRTVPGTDSKQSGSPKDTGATRPHLTTTRRSPGRTPD